MIMPFATSQPRHSPDSLQYPAVAACSVQIGTPTTHLQLIPEGQFKGMDGRPFECGHWVLTPERGRAIVAALNRSGVDMVIDYEHGTLAAAESGQPAPASGWLAAGQFEYVPGLGVCSAKWRWVGRADQMIAAQQYRYLSPVFTYSQESGEVQALLHVALTNTPNLDTLGEALLAAASRLAPAANNHSSTPNTTPQATTQGASDMDELLERLRWTLNLPITATAAEVLAELAKLTELIMADTGVEIAANGKSLIDALGAYKALAVAANSKAPDPAQFVPVAVVTELRAQLAAATSASAATEVDQLITAACSDGRLRGDAHIAWARNLGAANPQALREHLEATPVISALTTRQTQAGNTPVAANRREGWNGSPELDAMAKQFGYDVNELGGAP